MVILHNGTSSRALCVHTLPRQLTSKLTGKCLLLPKYQSRVCASLLCMLRKRGAVLQRRGSSQGRTAAIARRSWQQLVP